MANLDLFELATMTAVHTVRGEARVAGRMGQIDPGSADLIAAACDDLADRIQAALGRAAERAEDHRQDGHAERMAW